jgi:hypothetical protein
MTRGAAGSAGETAKPDMWTPKKGIMFVIFQG